MKNKTESIRKIVGYLNNPEKEGGFWLPNIQRPFVWSEDQIQRLFDSVLREYPISTFLVWKTKSEIKTRRFIEKYRSNTKLSDYNEIPNEEQKLLVLDGQQRLQSFFIGLQGSYEKKELYFNVLSGKQAPPDDIRYEFKFIDKKNVALPWVRFKDVVFSNKPRQMAKDILSKFDDITDEQSEIIEDNLMNAHTIFATSEVITYQEIDSVDNPENYNDDDVVEIFIRANSGGTRLGKSDLLFSLLTSSWDDADENMEDLLENLNGSEFNFSRDFILKTCLSLLNKGASYKVEKFRDGKTKEQIINDWTNISNSILDVRDFIATQTYIRTDKAMPSYLGLIPVIYFRYHYPDKWKKAKGLDTYFLRTLIAGSFSGTPDNLIDKCTKKITELSDFDTDIIFGVIKADGRNLDITKNTILEATYGSKQIHMIFNLLYKDFNYRPAYKNNLPQVDHIFPQAHLKKVKEVNPTTGKRNIRKYKVEFRDQIANCMLLSAGENGAGGKSDTLPEVWFSDKDDNYLDMHLIPKDKNLWKMEKFEDFIEARKALIEEKFSYMIQEEVGND
tara:strand:- start:158736 stop:160415 length:1680 start_codon:yes stop_codon:yes gene_type:complete